MDVQNDSPRILIVEDESLIAIDMMNTLELMGYTIQEAVESGEKALESIKHARPDLVLMDIQLPGEIDGIEAATVIHEVHKIPVIFVSAFSDQITVSRAKLSQPFGYITKPFNNRELHTAIEMALYKHHMESLLEDSRELLSTTLKSIGDFVITTDADGTILFLNDSAADFFGGTAEDFMGKSIITDIDLAIYDGNAPADGLHEGAIDRKAGAVISALSQTVRETRSRTICNDQFRKTCGSEIVECRASPLVDPSSLSVKGIVYVFRDISGQVKIREMQERLASIVECSEDAIIGLSTDGRIESWNRGAGKIFGYEPDEVSGKSIALLSPAYQVDELPQSLERIAEGESIQHFETLCVGKDGRIINISLTLSPMRNAFGTIFGISLIGKDVSETRMLERQIMDLSTRERQSIGQELHDNLGQILTGTLFRTEALRNMLQKKGACEESTLSEDITGLLRNALGETRKLARGLMPVSMKSEGLLGALKEMSEQAESLFGIPVTLDLDEEIVIDDPVTATQLYGIAREAVNNALKHGKPESVSLRLERDESELVLTVQDDGIGFYNPDSEGLGLRIMKYRSKMIGGYFEVFSPSEGGTLVICRVSIPTDLVSDK